jgi:ribA/ribD-fused uncharacterized protein
MKTFEEYGYVIKDGVLAFQRGPLSQWFGGYKSQNSDFIWNGVTYNCTEQFMMAEKARVFEDLDTLSEILEEKDPRKQKALGRKVKNFDHLAWDLEKFRVVVTGNVLKFSQNRELERFLFKTLDHTIVEASPWDNIWGVGTGPEDETTFDPGRWQGQNLLGKALMETRGILSYRKGIQPITPV